MYRLGLVDTLVTHADMKGLGLTHLFGDRCGFMPPQLKTKQTRSVTLSHLSAWSSSQYALFDPKSHPDSCIQLEFIILHYRCTDHRSRRFSIMLEQLSTRNGLEVALVRKL
jgi:hypothetical protein